MSENTKPVVIEPNRVAPLSHRRILWTMAIVVFIAAILCSVFVSRAFGLGLCIGGILAFLNYYWLKISLKRVFDKAIGGEQPVFLAGTYFLRYLSIGVVVFIVYLTEIVPIIALLLGLSAFALAIMVEGLLRIFSPISKREEF